MTEFAGMDAHEDAPPEGINGFVASLGQLPKFVDKLGRSVAGREFVFVVEPTDCADMWTCIDHRFFGKVRAVGHDARFAKYRSR